MTRTTFLPFSAPAIAVIISGSAFAIELEEIIQAHENAVGGRDAISKIDNFRRDAVVSIESGFGPLSGTATEIADIKGQRFRSGLDLGAFQRTEVTTDKSGWFQDTQKGDGELNAEQTFLAKSSIGVSPLLTVYTSHQGDLTLGDTSKFNNQRCHRIDWGAEASFFVNTRTKLLEGISFSTGSLIVHDYQRIDGVWMPGKRTLKVNAQGLVINYSFASTKTNITIDDSVFANEFGSKTNPNEDGDGGLGFTAQQVMNLLDKDGNNTISEDEANAALRAFFASVDSNRDGAVDAAEAKAMIEFLKSQNPVNLATVGKTTAKQIIASMDKNNDGKVAKDESNAELEPFFDEVDANSDGFIDEGEAQTVADYANENE